jgi:hypothetical protein
VPIVREGRYSAAVSAARRKQRSIVGSSARLRTTRAIHRAACAELIHEERRFAVRDAERKDDRKRLPVHRGDHRRLRGDLCGEGVGERRTRKIWLCPRVKF